MKGDKIHAQLLERGLRWDGRDYEWVPNGEDDICFKLEPAVILNPSHLKEMREGEWNILIYRGNGFLAYRVKMKTFSLASMFFLGHSLKPGPTKKA